MNTKEQYKRIVKFGSAAIILLIEIGLYWALWYFHLNTIIEVRFWRRGIWLLAAMYGALLFFFLQTYGGLKIGYLKRGNIIYSHILSLLIANVIGYIILALVDKRFHAPTSFIILTLIDAALVCAWVFLFQWIYSVLFPPRRLLVVYGNRPVFSKVGIDEIMKRAEEFEGMVVGDIPSHDRNLLLKKCYDAGIRVYMIPKISDILIRTSTNLNLFDTPILLSRNEGLQADQMLVKRIIDVVVSVIGIIITMPLFVIFGAAIHLTDRGPIFYKQTRLTLDGKLFEIYKFRTMREDAEKDGIARLAGEDDDRITAVGKILRATRFDELPQLFNIIKGEMSLVGPRPERPEIAAEYMKELPEFSMRLKMKAGLTGYAQVHGKYNTTPYDKLKLDLHYIRNYSIWMDLILIVLTPKVLFMKESTEGVGEGEITANSKDK